MTPRLLLALALPGVQAAEGGSLRDARAGESSVHTGDTAHGCSGVHVCAAETNTRALTRAPGPISSTRLVRPPPGRDAHGCVHTRGVKA